VTLTDENNATETQLENRPFDINDILDVDSNVINYGQFICGKILGSTLLLSNLGETDQVITLNLNKQKIYDCDEIFGQYNREELPFEYTDGTEIRNSEVDYNCWFIENPANKELQKQITIKISPKTQQEFIIVIKAPKTKLVSRIVSFIDIVIDDALPQTEKQLSHKSHEVVLKESKKQKIEVLLLGYLDNPPIKCTRQLYN